MSLTITPVTVDEGAAEAYAVYRAAVAVDLPLAPIMTRRSFDSLYTHPWPSERSTRYLVRANGVPVAVGMTEFPLKENLATASIGVAVHPEHRRQGIGSEVYRHLEDLVRAEEGRTKIFAQTNAEIPGCPPGDLAGVGFAEKLGFAAALPEVARQLVIETLDRPALAKMLAEAWEKAPGYRLVRWNGIAPDDLIDGVAYLDGRLIQDAPMGDLDVEPQKVDAARVREHEEALSARGRSTVHAGAVHEATGALAAWTTICLDPEADNGQAMQFITIVDPDHRGHRLGTIVKIENLYAALAQDPDINRITTWNAAANDYMISINEAMGFRAAYGLMEWQKNL
ncbi:GNAT family N-acetyltransferase [Hamadaea tsunoensis]|uniref:GNAT family N-acetyltransferase n=1 Tax=Hamadaea tsunoensis TaxID=53368 RepID=UPI0004879E0B|nr:GNAT family N-acetyltransferase [Hamadaea tsunoensis]